VVVAGETAGALSPCHAGLAVSDAWDELDRKLVAERRRVVRSLRDVADSLEAAPLEESIGGWRGRPEATES